MAVIEDTTADLRDLVIADIREQFDTAAEALTEARERLDSYDTDGLEYARVVGVTVLAAVDFLLQRRW